MHGALTPLFHTRMAIPNPWQLLSWAAPVLAVAALWWLANRTDQIINYLFPNLKWEKSLGWLNIKAERRAKTALRWIGYGIHLLLAGMLCGIVWVADGFPALDDWPATSVVRDLLIRIPVLAVCLGTWLLYLGCWLIPKLHAEREEAALKKFRAEAAEIEMEHEARRPRSRIKSPLKKPRTDVPLTPSAPDRAQRRDQPGG